jgi:beta-lactam-binding protein with PASTA domain
MRTRITAAVTGALLLATLTACGSTTGSSSGSPAETGAKAPAAKSGGAETAALPNFVGKGLQSAQDEAQAVGFYRLASHDAFGRGRMQALDRNWKVCSQTPAPGEHPTDAKVDFGTVKLEEQCPAGGNQAEPEAAGGTMPNLNGKSVKVARQALDSSTSITVNDSTGQDRMVIVESNWQVCKTDPAAGAKLNGQPVTIDAVKFTEDC